MSLKLQGTFKLPHIVIRELIDGIILERVFNFEHEDGRQQRLFVRRVAYRLNATNIHVIVGKLTLNGEEKQISFSYDHSQIVIFGQAVVNYTIEDQLELELAHNDPSSDVKMGKDLR